MWICCFTILPHDLKTLILIRWLADIKWFNGIVYISGKTAQETGWKKFADSEYNIFLDEKLYLEAKKTCKENNANLASICSAEEERYIIDMIP